MSARKAEADDAPGIDARELSGLFTTPRWLRDMGLTAWLLVGVTLLLVGSVVTIGGGSLFGAVGLILAAPLTSAVTKISADLARSRAESAAEAQRG